MDWNTIPRFAGMPESCGYCGMHHSGTCPRVKSIEYHQNGTVKRVEFHEQQFVTVGRPDPTVNPAAGSHSTYVKP